MLAGPTVTHFERLQLTHAARKTTLNASALLTAFSRTDVPVYAGAAKPSVRDAAVHAPAIHGESGIDGTDLLPPRPREGVLETYAVHAMAEALMLAAEEAERDDKPRPWLVATGALTNVAELLRRHPELVHRLAGLSIMGGAIGGGHTDAVLGKVEGIERFGNLTPWAEFNIIIDPEAAAEVFNNKELAAKTTMIPLDVRGGHRSDNSWRVRAANMEHYAGHASRPGNGRGPEATSLRAIL